MKKQLYLFLLLLFSLSLLSSCNDRNNTTTTTYPEALITSLSFASNDSFPGLAEARFSIITSSDTGLIYNRDSLRFGTSLDSVVPRFTFNHTPSYTVITTDSDTVIYSGNDTVNLNCRPCMVYVMASDQEHFRWYELYVNVHQIDPDLYVWEQLTPGVFSADGAESKAFYSNGSFYLFVNNGFSTSLYTSADAATWSSAQTISGLPANCSVRKMLEADGTIYYPDGTTLYTSQDGLLWTATDYASADFRLLNMLYQFNDSIWAIAQRTADDKLQMVNMAPNGRFALAGDILPDNFPVSDYATLSFASAAQRARTMIVGGFDLNGNSLNTRWNIEFLASRGYNITNFSIEQPNFEPLTGVSLVWYDHAIHMFGSANANTEIGDYVQLVSPDEGMNWSVPNQEKNALPADYLPRQKASVFEGPDHYIYIIGGQNRSAAFSDVWRGRLNRTQFPDYE